MISPALVHRVLDRLMLAFILSLTFAIISSLMIVNQWPRLVFCTLASVCSVTGGLLAVTDRGQSSDAAAQGYLTAIIGIALAYLSAQIATGLGAEWLGIAIMVGCAVIAASATAILRVLDRRAAR